MFRSRAGTAPACHVIREESERNKHEHEPAGAPEAGQSGRVICRRRRERIGHDAGVRTKFFGTPGRLTTT